ncbi:unnamed protein product [Strongylus vulgaris]|uniref:Major facilitator superfamily (MFS) profile domain-containing protein n=1 Tax=Strongylus vulgaris TaxID=40348 RepID=A0A3P7LBE0_STRVU|nr:unnamed protein product [Strongylus vulgaris]
MAKICNTIVWCSQSLLYTEATTTSVRNVFCGVAGFLGDLGSVAAPYLKRLEAIHKSAPALAIVVMSLISAGIVLIMPETKDKKLPEDLDDFDPGPLLRWMKKKKDEKVEEVQHSIEFIILIDINLNVKRSPMLGTEPSKPAFTEEKTAEFEA